MTIGVAMDVIHQTFPPLQPHQNADNFYLAQSSHIFDSCEAADEVLSLSFNYDPNGERVNKNTAAIGLFLESNYNSGGAHWKEFQLRFTGKDNVQHRPWSWRINENNFTDWTLITETYGFTLRNPVNGADYVAGNPTGIAFISESALAAKKAVRLSDDGANVILSRYGGGDFLFHGFKTVFLPGGLLSERYNEFKSPTHFQDVFVKGDLRAPESSQLKAMQAQIDTLMERVAQLENRLAT